MLKPRESDIPALFLVLVVLPLVAYILLGKWSEAAKKKERISLLAELAAEEALRAEAMAAASVIPLVHSSTNGVHLCARCFGPATTRCSRCKSVRYCSGKCQIIHWREVHKQECQQMETISSSSSPKYSSNEESIHERILFDEKMNYGMEACSTVDTSGVSISERRSTEKRISRKPNREMLRNGDSMHSEEEAPQKNKVSIPGRLSNGVPTSRSTTHESHKKQSQRETMLDLRPNFGMSSSLGTANDGMNMCDDEMEWSACNDETEDHNCSSEMTSIKRSIKTKSASNHLGTKMYRSPKPMTKASREQSCSEMERNGQISDDLKISRIRDTSPTKGSNGIASMGIMKMIGLRKSSKLERQMLFPYDEFVKYFQSGVFNLSPRGLVNCGNSCYANAVLQCLTSTKPLLIYLLRRSHSRSCCVKNWCLMCELEQHVMMMRESEGPLSPGRILSHMRGINCQIGDGSQEDAHEFLRLLVTSMQSICLEGLGGEKVVDPRLQETTFIQHTFGGRLRSKVKCLKCHHESERYENIMDLTLEINGWVESLEDALTQFTTPEDLDGENMYRCGRCASYVRAWKQLSIHEAPNILTIVLKRFQKGSYGKINKCVTFPEMLDMIRFMTGKDDIPPLYLLYALVVHLDTLNASFSGHYVSYVKDLQGNWFRIDDTEVQPVPMSQVMSEGAYILFYMRSSPRPVRSYTGTATQHQPPGFAKRWTPKTHKSSRQEGQGKSSCHFVGPEPLSHHRPSGFTNHTSNSILSSKNRNELPVMEFSDATSSDFSIFTSSDDASFTTESTRDSFSTVDYSDPSNMDPISSIFNTSYGPEYSYNRTVSCSMFSSCKPETRFVSERNGVVVEMNGENSSEPFLSDRYAGLYVQCGCNPIDGLFRTSCHCKR